MWLYDYLFIRAFGDAHLAFVVVVVIKNSTAKQYP